MEDNWPTRSLNHHVIIGLDFDIGGVMPAIGPRRAAKVAKVAKVWACRLNGALGTIGTLDRD